MQINWNKKSDNLFVSNNIFYRIIDLDEEFFSEIGENGTMWIFEYNGEKVYVSLKGKMGEFIGWVYSLETKMCNFHKKGGCPTFSCSDTDPIPDFTDDSVIPRCCQVH